MARRRAVISHWHYLVEGFQTSALDFYAAVEEGVKVREVPDTFKSRVEFKEGGLASARRQYLRIERRNVAFDICAAPFGTGFFFSWWLTRLGPAYPLLYILGFLLLLFLGAFFLMLPLILLVSLNQEGYAILILFFSFPVTLVFAAVGLAFLARKEVFGPEEQILEIPILGWIYDKVFNPITYYSLDTALMFQESIRHAVNDAINGTLSEQGVRALSEEQMKPTIRDLAR